MLFLMQDLHQPYSEVANMRLDEAERLWRVYAMRMEAANEARQSSIKSREDPFLVEFLDADEDRLKEMFGLGVEQQ